jgi:glutamate mutase epsilon subunit
LIVGCYANNDEGNNEKGGDDDDDDAVIKLMVGTTEIITKSFRKYLSNTLRKYNIMGLQNTAVLDNAHVPGEVVIHKYKSLSWEITSYVL